MPEETTDSPDYIAMCRENALKIFTPFCEGLELSDMRVLEARRDERGWFVLVSVAKLAFCKTITFEHKYGTNEVVVSDY